MEETNGDKAKTEIALQARFNERDKKENENWPLNKGRENFQNFGGRESKVPRISTLQNGENIDNRAIGSNNFRGENFRSRGGRRMND